jgi:hypothetical protein
VSQANNELLKAIKEKYPNPGRVGCPEQSILREMVENIHAHTELFYHVITCGACIQDYESYKVNRQTRQRRRYAILSAAALAVVVAGGYFVWERTRPSTVSPKETTSTIKKDESPGKPDSANSSPSKEEKLKAGKEDKTASVPLAVQVVDIRDRAVFRGEETAEKQKPVQLFRRKRELRILLPLGSGAGNYEVQLFRIPKEPLLTVVGKAERKDKDTVLPVVLDTATLPKGEYQLGIRPLGWSWTNYPVRLE